MAKGEQCGLKGVSEGEVVKDEVGEAGGGAEMQGLAGHGEDCAFHSKFNGKDHKQRTDMI